MDTKSVYYCKHCKTDEHTYPQWNSADFHSATNEYRLPVECGCGASWVQFFKPTSRAYEKIASHS